MFNKSLKKRITAAAMAVITVIGMYQGSVPTLASDFTYNDGDDGLEVVLGNGESISTTFDINSDSTTKFQKIDKISFGLLIPNKEGENSVTYNWSVSTGEIGSGSESNSNTPVAAEEDPEYEVYPIEIDVNSSVALAQGQSVTVSVNFPTGAVVTNGGKIKVYASQADAPDDVSSISLKVNGNSVSDSYYISKDQLSNTTLTVSADPGKDNRYVYCTSPDITGYGNGDNTFTLSSGLSVGKYDYNFTSGSTTTTLQLYVYDADITPVTFGGNPETNTTVYNESGVMSASDYSVAYDSDTNVGTHTATITVTGKLTFTKNYTIVPKELKSADFTSAKWSVNASTGEATATSVSPLTSADFEATAILVKSVPGKNVYNITVNGIGNYSGSVELENIEVQTSGDGGSSVDINDVFVAEITDSLTYDSNPKTPKPVIKDLSGNVLADMFGDDGYLSLTYDNNVNASDEAKCTITGKPSKGYTGSMDVYFTIDPRDISTGSDVDVALTGANIQVDSGNFYAISTGSRIEPKTTVSISGNSLVENTDYTLSYSNNISVSPNAQVTITGTGNYTGSRDVKFEIVANVDQDVYVKIGSAAKVKVVGGKATTTYSTPYTGEDVTPAVVVYSGNTVIPTSAVSYANNKDAGTATATIEFAGKYAGGSGTKTITATYSITPISIQISTVTLAKTSFVYSGNPVTVSGTVIKNGKTLTEGADYDITYNVANPTNAGVYTAIFTGKGNYTGSKSVSFKISPLDLSDSSVTISDVASQAYTGNEIKPAVTLLINGNPVSDGYKVEYPNAKNCGTYQIKVLADSANFIGQKTTTFTITQKSMGDLKYTLGGMPLTIGADGTVNSGYSSDTLVYDRTNKTIPASALVVQDASTGRILTRGTDYNVSYTDNINAGVNTAHMHISAGSSGNYSDSTPITINFTIKPRNIANSSISTSKYTVGTTPVAGVILPKFTIKDNGNSSLKLFSLKEGVDYSVAAKTDCNKAGDQTCTITGIGNYTGTRDVDYQIGNSIDNAEVVLFNPYTDTAFTDGEFGPNVNSGKTIPYLGEKLPIVKIKYGATYFDLSDMGIKPLTKDDFVSTWPAPGGDIYNSYNNYNKVSFELDATGSTVFYGTRTLTYGIVTISLDKATVVDNDPATTEDYAFKFTGNTIDINPTGDKDDEGAGKVYLMVNGMVVDPSEYTVSKTNIGAPAGDYPITFTANSGNYAGSKTQTFKITVGSFKSITINGGDSFSYTESAIEPKVTIKDAKDNVLVEGVDYELSYTNNTDISTSTSKAKVIATGKGNYLGATIEKEFTITQVNLATIAGLTVTADPVEYTGPGMSKSLEDINFTVKLNGETLTRGAGVAYDYNASIGSMTAADIGLAKNSRGIAVTITGNNVKYTGTKVVYVDLKANLATLFKGEVDGVDLSSPMNISDWKALAETGIKVLDKSDSTALPNDKALYTIKKSALIPGAQTITITGKNGAYNSITLPVNVKGSLDDVTVTIDRDTYDYTGTAIRPLPVVKYDGVVVPSNIYEVEFGSNTDVGKGSVKIKTPITGNHFWTDGTSKTKEFDIVYNLNNAVITLDSASYTYDGLAKEPAITVTINGTTVDPSYYDVKFANNTNVGTATVTVAAKADQPVRGQNTKTFKISAITSGVSATFSNGSGSTIEKYTGDPIEPAVTVKKSSTPLLEGKDYSVTYANNTNVTTADSKAHAFITLQGNYSGSIELDFEITPKSFADVVDAVSIVADPAYFTGNPIAPMPTYTVSYKGRTLREHIDFEFAGKSYADAANLYGVNAGKLTLKGINNFTGEQSVYYDINSLDIGSDNSGVIIDSTSEYDGTNHYSKVSSNVKLYYKDSTEPLNSKYYTVTVAGVTGSIMTDAGTYSIVITGVGGFTGSRQTDYTIEPAKIANENGVLNATRFNASLSDDAYEYLDGSPVMPGDFGYLTVTDKDCNHTQKTLVKDVDYTVTYSNNQAAASKDDENGPRLIITGMGNYQGTYEIPFSIGTDLGVDGMVDAVLAPPEAEYTYDGKMHVPTITRLTYDGTTELVLGKDFRIKSLPTDQINAGDKEIIIEGIGKYYGEVAIPYVIKPKMPVPSFIRIVLPSTLKDGKGYYAVYTGEDIEPAVEVYDDAISKTKPIDPAYYTVSYVDNHDVSVDKKAVVKVELKGNYVDGGDVNPVYFEIRGREMGGMSLTVDSATVAYNESAIVEDGDGNKILAPVETVVYDDGISPTAIELTKDYDYKVTYQYYGYNPDDPTNCENPDNVPVAGPVKLTVTGLGNYTGEKTIQYIIYGDLSEIPDNAIADQLYTGEKIVPDITGIVCGGRYLKPEDVKLSVTSPDGYTEKGTLYIDANNSYYTNRKMCGFNIVFNASNIKVEMPDGTDYVYTGKPIEPKFVVTTNDGAAVPDGALEVTYKNTAKGTADHTNVGDITATIKLTVGAKELSVDKPFRIVPVDINNDGYIKAFIVGTNYYDGGVIDPYMELRRKSDSEKLVLDRDFAAVNRGDSNGNRTKPTVDGDPAIIEVTGKGNYTGTRLLEYTIQSPALTGLRATGTTDTTADITWSRISAAHGYQIELPSGNVVSIPGNSTTAYTVTGLVPSNTSSIKVRTYVTIGGTTYYGAYSTLNVTTNLSKSEGTGSSNSATTATVSWNAETSAAQGIIGYKIFRSTSRNGAYSLVAIVPRTRNAYTDGNLTSGTTYYYKIQAYKYDGTYIYSPESDPIAITVR